MDMTIRGWTNVATKELRAAGIESALLDAEIILAHTIKCGRTYLHAHPDEEIDTRHLEIANARLDLRLDRVPIAYIIGHKEFYGRRFQVSPAVLVPRPESEEMITILKSLLPHAQPLPGMPTKRLVDIGSGSGCLGITAKLEFPELDVSLIDISKPAMAVAKKNAEALSADVQFFQSDLLAGYPYSPDIVLANLPYVDRSWEMQSPELEHEPADALYADQDGLAIISRCLSEVARRSKPGCILILEADPRQFDAIASMAHENGFKEHARHGFVISFLLTN